jgi:hypothetical protein
MLDASKACAYPGGERVGPRRVSGEELVATSDGERGEDCKSERDPELCRGVEQSGGEAGLAGRNPGIGGDGGADEDRAEPECHHGEAGEQVGGVAAVSEDVRGTSPEDAHRLPTVSCRMTNDCAYVSANRVASVSCVSLQLAATIVRISCSTIRSLAVRLVSSSRTFNPKSET